MGRKCTTGGDYLQRSASAFATGSDPRPLTFSMWARPQFTLIGGYSLAVLFQNDDNGGSPSVAIVQKSDGAIDVYSGGFAAANTGDLTAVTAINQWHMYSFTWDGSNNLKIFIDGVKKATTTLSRVAPPAAGASVLGFLLGAGFGFDGDVSEVAGWNSVLSEAQVASLYTGAETGLSADSVGTPAFYVPILGIASPEPETVGGGSWSISGTVAASTTIGGSPAHPTITSGGGGGGTPHAFVNAAPLASLFNGGLVS